ncbi:MAG: c-type cytochrome [Betaproteobacteria bacterium]|nr:c-type cytochrome [Betaproteobacteria bacterium]
MTSNAADGDAEAGRRKTVTCNGCHGQANMKAVPNLGGQSATYFIAAMRAYQDAKRGHATMRDVAKAYSDKELKNFAAYYAQFAASAETPVPGSETPAGARACETCHGVFGRVPVNPDSAVLAGQKPVYLKTALREYREGTRPHAVMREAVGDLQDAEIDALAEYFAGLPGLVVK